MKVSGQKSKNDLDRFSGKVKHGKMLELKISWKIFKIFTQGVQPMAFG